MFYRIPKNSMEEIITEKELHDKEVICLIRQKELGDIMNEMQAKEIHDLYAFAVIALEFNKKKHFENFSTKFPIYGPAGEYLELIDYDHGTKFRTYNFMVRYMEDWIKKKNLSYKDASGIDFADLLEQTKVILKSKDFDADKEKKLKQIVAKAEEIDEAMAENKE